jgi:hypothetical protein
MVSRRLAVGVGVLVAAQVVVALLAADVRVVAERVAMPDVDEDALERDARVAVDLRDDPVEGQDGASLTEPSDVSIRMSERSRFSLT